MCVVRIEGKGEEGGKGEETELHPSIFTHNAGWEGVGGGGSLHTLYSKSKPKLYFCVG